MPFCRIRLHLRPLDRVCAHPMRQIQEKSEFHAPMVVNRRKNFLFHNGKAEFFPFQRIFLNFFHFCDFFA